MADYNKIHAFVEHLAEKVHNLGADQFTVALLAAANAPDPAADVVLGDLTEIDYTNCSSRNLTVSSSAQSGGTYKQVIADLVLTASGGTVGPFRYVVIYNNTPSSPADPLVGYYDYGSEITLQEDESFNIDLDPDDGLLQLA